MLQFKSLSIVLTNFLFLISFLVRSFFISIKDGIVVVIL
jgi:hypothetical protein